MRVRKQGPWTAPAGPLCEGMKKGEAFASPHLTATAVLVVPLVQRAGRR